VRRTVRIDSPWVLSIGNLAMIGDHVHLAGPEEIRIGDRCTISQLACLTTECLEKDTHTDSPSPRRGPIIIERDTWIAADTLVLPAVTVGERSLLGSRSVLNASVPPGMIFAGHPAKPLRERVLRDAET